MLFFFMNAANRESQREADREDFIANVMNLRCYGIKTQKQRDNGMGMAQFWDEFVFLFSFLRGD